MTRWATQPPGCFFAKVIFWPVMEKISVQVHRYDISCMELAAGDRRRVGGSNPRDIGATVGPRTRSTQWGHEPSWLARTKRWGARDVRTCVQPKLTVYAFQQGRNHQGSGLFPQPVNNMEIFPTDIIRDCLGAFFFSGWIPQR